MFGKNQSKAGKNLNSVQLGDDDVWMVTNKQATLQFENGSDPTLLTTYVQPP